MGCEDFRPAVKFSGLKLRIFRCGHFITRR
jgi:hypothetical protein